MSMVYDYVVIGSGLSGLTIATALSKETSKVLLLDSADLPGGWLRKLHLPFVPATQPAKSAILNLENLLNIKILGAVQEAAPITYESATFKEFLGFGEKSPEFYEEIAFYISPEHYQLKSNRLEWVKLLMEKFQGTFQPRSIVTKFVVENGKVQSLVVNGTKKVLGHNFIYCGEMKSLEVLMPQDFINPKLRTKLNKTKTWTRASLQLQHANEVTDTPALHILIGTANDEVVTCVGQFEGKQSTWTTFVADEEAEDPEITAQALKRIKKQIKRAYPESLNDPIEEKIVVQSEFGGHFDVKLNANQTWPEIENLWMGSSTLQKDRNVVGALKQAWLVLASLGFSVTAENPMAANAQDLNEQNSEIKESNNQNEDLVNSENSNNQNPENKEAEL